jgi:putative hydrolase of the HAD superfamily
VSAVPLPDATLGGVGMRAVAFDIGDVLERIDAPVWLERWRARLGWTPERFEAALDAVDPEGLIVLGALSEGDVRAAYAREFSLTKAQADAFMADLWDWYCGSLDSELVDYVRALRGRVRLGILSNSADGARREETRRFRLPELVDVLLYSHEIGLAKPDPAAYLLLCERLGVRPDECVFVDDLAENVAAAAELGFRVVVHHSAARTIAAVDAMLAEA